MIVDWAKRQRAQQDVTFPVGHVTIRSFAQPTSTRQYNIDGVLETYQLYEGQWLLQHSLKDEESIKVEFF